MLWVIPVMLAPRSNRKIVRRAASARIGYCDRAEPRPTPELEPRAAPWSAR